MLGRNKLNFKMDRRWTTLDGIMACSRMDALEAEEAASAVDQGGARPPKWFQGE